MTEFKNLLEQAGLTNVSFAKETGQPLRTVQEWASGKTYNAPPVAIWGIKHYIYEQQLIERIASKLKVK